MYVYITIENQDMNYQCKNVINQGLTQLYTISSAYVPWTCLGKEA